MEVTRRSFLTGAALTALGCARAWQPGAGRGPRADPYRLPSTVVPQRYELRIEPDLSLSEFTGEETISVTVREAVEEVVLNAAQLRIEHASARDAGGRVLAGESRLDAATERVTIRFPETLAPGPWELALRFGGTIGERLQGFYRSTARGAGGRETALAITQLQSTEARRVFPCWDEPAFKAVLQLTLVVGEPLTALSNSRPIAAEVIPGSGKKAVRFAPTIPMSTYLVAFVVGDLESTEPVTVDGVPLRIWAVRGHVHLAGFAREAGASALRFFREYYGVAYPGDKLDLIAVPDFESGAMENFGAVIFRETNLLVDEGRASLGELQSVADNVAHEIAHMWFGDLVTMAWWNGLWLNEAFATFMQLLAVDALHPTWNRWTRFGVAREGALEIDALSSTRPVEYDVRTPADAEAMFDTLTYHKGAAILRMLERHLGADVFRQGIRRYLSRYEFGNAETRDLWAALAEVSGQAVAALMDAWVLRPGYPTVTVSLEAGGRRLVLSQQRFTYEPAGAAESDPWQVPVHFRVHLPAGVRSMRLVLSSTAARIELPAPADWVVVNENGYGFYRTRYAPALLARLAEDPFGRLSAIERFGLVSDVWAGARAGLVPLTEYLDLTARFEAETDRSVWTALIDSFTYLDRAVEERDRPAVAALVRCRLGPAAAALGWAPAPGEGEIRGELRADLLRTLGTLGQDAATRAAARKLGSRSIDDPAALDPSLAAAVIAIRADGGTEADWAEFAGRFRTATTAQEAARYLFSLARFREPALIERTLAMAIDGQVRSQDAPFLVRDLLLNVSARELAWRFVKEHWGAMQRHYTPAGLAAMCEGLPALTAPGLEADVRGFFSSRGISLGGKILEQYLETLRVAVRFRRREGSTLTAYLSRFSS